MPDGIKPLACEHSCGVHVVINFTVSLQAHPYYTKHFMLQLLTWRMNLEARGSIVGGLVSEGPLVNERLKILDSTQLF